jgi:hypothetical protein
MRKLEYGPYSDKRPALPHSITRKKQIFVPRAKRSIAVPWSERGAEYAAWVGMKQRCYNPHPSHKYWHGRGIRVCQRWLKSFRSFLNDMGRMPTPGLTLDRIKSSQDYRPGNCRWATKAEQVRSQERFLNKRK